MARVVILIKCTVLVMLAVVVASCTVHSTRSYVCDYADVRSIKVRVIVTRNIYNAQTQNLELRDSAVAEGDMLRKADHVDELLLPKLLSPVCEGEYYGRETRPYGGSLLRDGMVIHSVSVKIWPPESDDTLLIHLTKLPSIVWVKLIQPKDAKFLLVFDYGNPFRLSRYADFLTLSKSETGPIILDLAKEVFQKSAQPVPEVLSSFEAFEIDTAR